MVYTTVVIFCACLISASASAEVLSDPMRPYTPQIRIENSPGGQSYSLSAILYSAQRRVAIVNGQPVSEGQRISGARVVRIAPGQVQLEVDGEILKLVLIKDKKAK